MEIGLEGKVMDAMMLSRLTQDRLYLRFNEIASLSGVKKSTLQRILPRLINRKWIQKIVTHSYSDTEPKGKVGKLVPVLGENKKGEERMLLLPEEDMDIIDEGYPNLERTIIKHIFSQKIPDTEKQSLRKALEDMDIRKRRRILLDKSMKFSGRSKLINNIFLYESKSKEYSFYKLIEYPYQYRIREGNTASNEKNIVSEPWNTPEGTKRFWKNAAQDLLVLKKKWRDIIPKTNLIPRQLR